jgi:cytochrome P450
MSDLLFEPSPPPPPAEALARSRLRAQVHMLRSAWRAGGNLLHMIHPNLGDRPWLRTDLGLLRLTTVNDAGLARRILSENASAYAKSHLYQALLADLIGPTASLITDGEMARYKRRLISPAFNARSLARLEGVVARHVDAALDRWAAMGPGAEIDLSVEAPRLAMEAAMDAFFSTTLGARAQRLAAILDETMMAAGSPSMADVLTLPGWVPRRSRRFVRRHIAEIDAILRDVIEARAARTGPAPDSPDILDIVLAATDAETGGRLSREEGRNEVITLFLAGHETTALSLAWGLDRLAREPEAQDAAAAAAGAAERAKGAPLDAAEARATPPIAETYDEMLRLYPPAYVIGRMALEPDRFEDLDIRPGDQFQIAVFLLHRNPRYWRDPGAFDPGRFREAGRRDAFLPFGAGPRNCVGMAMARMEAHLLLARALPRFRFEPVGPPPEPVGKITLRSRDPVRVRLIPRMS